MWELDGLLFETVLAVELPLLEFAIGTLHPVAYTIPRREKRTCYESTSSKRDAILNGKCGWRGERGEESYERQKRRELR